MKSLYLFTLLLMAGCSYAVAQDTTALKRIIARFDIRRSNGSPEYGTGFIVARQGDTLYLVTAGHVLRYRAHGAPVVVTHGNSTDTLHAAVRLFRDTDKGDSEDLAVCSVVSKGYTYPEIQSLDILRPRVPVFFYHKNGLKPDFGVSKQTLITLDDSANTYRIRMPGVDGGDSGGPVFTAWLDPYLAGIILSGDKTCEVLRIDHILNTIKKEIPGLNQYISTYYEKNDTPDSAAAH